MTSPHTPNFEYGFACAKAEYEPHRIARYATNPLCNVFRDFPKTTNELARRLTRLPDFSPDQRLLDGMTRRILIKQLFRVTIGTPRLRELAETINATMLEGYFGREPYSVSANTMLQELYKQQKTGSFFKPVSMTRARNTAQFTSALLGMPGSGKSFGLDAVAGLYPPVIHHEELNIYQIPTVTLEMPYRGASAGTLAHAIIYELDRLFPLGEYARLYLKSRVNSEQLLLAAFALLHIHCVGHVIIDEGQNKNYEEEKKPKSGKQTPVATMLITASNRMQIPLIFSGTSEMKDVLGSRMSLIRRMAGNGMRQWGPLELVSSITNEPSEFDTFINVLWKYQWLREPAALTPRLRQVMYHYTLGIPDIVVKLFHGLQWRALNDRIETITEDLIHRVATGEMKQVVAVVAAIRTKDTSKLSRQMLSTISDLAAEYGIDSEEEEFNRKSLSRKEDILQNLRDELGPDPTEQRELTSLEPSADESRTSPEEGSELEQSLGTNVIEPAAQWAETQASESEEDAAYRLWSKPKEKRKRQTPQVREDLRAEPSSDWKDIGSD